MYYYKVILQVTKIKKINIVKIEIKYLNVIYKAMYFISIFNYFYSIFYFYFRLFVRTNNSMRLN